MYQFISLILSNLGFFLFLLSWVFVFSTYKISHLSFSENCFRWMALMPAGFTGIYTFIMHTFFREYAASTIGWKPSPFEYEVGIANLAIGIISLLAFKASIGFRKAVTIVLTFWLWGDATGHIYQMIVHHNFSAGNVGSWFWLDILLPLILIICLLKMIRD